MDILVVFLLATTLEPLPAASQHLGCTAIGSIRRFP